MKIELFENESMNNVTESEFRTNAVSIIEKLENRFSDRIIKNNDLTRALVSFQANRSEPIFRWFKYREGFSKALIEYFIEKEFADHYSVVLDPFAGTGATAFVANSLGMSAIGIELLPVGCFFIEARTLFRRMNNEDIISYAKEGIANKAWEKSNPDWTFPHLNITKNAFPSETEEKISRYKTWVSSLEQDKAAFFDFVLFSVLEDISYTRKDGQYLRWDHRSPRSKVKSKFSKGKIYTFDEAVRGKLQRIIEDLEENFSGDLFGKKSSTGNSDFEDITLLSGSNFKEIDKISDNFVDAVITSPPYCNRYDYTRTYALELAYLGCSELDIRQLRHALLSCTVEHREKDFSYINPMDLMNAQKAFDESEAIKAILDFLHDEKKNKRLNNNGIVNMVNGYFFESAVHLAQVSRKLKVGGKYIMVNDNVRYNGLDIPIDCILSELAENLGFRCNVIWKLPKGKGNSSQQMKVHGRSELRKCVYVWERVI